ncbi:unnamed protein product, partial [Pleuronectes platessa]
SVSENGREKKRVFEIQRQRRKTESSSSSRTCQKQSESEPRSCKAVIPQVETKIEREAPQLVQPPTIRCALKQGTLLSGGLRSTADQMCGRPQVSEPIERAESPDMKTGEKPRPSAPLSEPVHHCHSGSVVQNSSFHSRWSPLDWTCSV